MGRIACVLQKCKCWNPNLQCAVLGTGAFGRGLDNEGSRALMKGTSALVKKKKKAPEGFLSPPAL